MRQERSTPLKKSKISFLIFGGAIPSYGPRDNQRITTTSSVCVLLNDRMHAILQQFDTMIKLYQINTIQGTMARKIMVSERNITHHLS